MEKEYTRLLLDDRAGAMHEVVIREHELRDYELHRHDCFEFELVLSGTAKHTVNGISETIRRGDMYLILPTDIHGLENSTGGTLYNIMFRESLINEDILLEFLDSSSNTVHLGDTDFERMCFLIKSAMEESSSDKRFAMLYLHDLIECIVITFMRNQKSAQRRQIPQQGAIHNALLFTQSHFTSSLSLHDVASHVYLSDGYFSSLFHKCTGNTFKQYLNSLRLVLATKLLRSTSLSVTEICFSCGYTSYSHFLRIFKSEYGFSPGEYRANTAKAAAN